MKKIIIASILLTFAVAPVAVFAQLTTVPGSCTINASNLGRIQSGTGLTCNSPCAYDTNSSCGMCCVLNSFYTVTDWMFFFLVAIAVLFVIIGAFMFLFSGGSDEKIKTARNYLLYAAIAILVALLARAIPAIVKMVTGA